MAFDQRPPTSGGIDPDADPNLPIADASQGHDVVTGIAPSLAKLQDWIAWLRGNSVNVVNAGLQTIVGSLRIETFLSITGSVTVGADPGANVFHSGNIPKVCGRIITDGVGGYSIPSSGVNLGLATVTSTHVDVDFVRAFANADYCPVAVNISGTSHVAGVDQFNSTTTKIRLQMRDSSGVLVDPSANICRWSLIIMGRQ